MMHRRSESNQLIVYRGARQEPAERRISYFELGCEVNIEWLYRGYIHEKRQPGQVNVE